jgi:hypothetical protein
LEKTILAASSPQKGHLDLSIISTPRQFSRYFEEITHRANRKRALTDRSKPFGITGRGGGIRTRDPLHPMLARFHGLSQTKTHHKSVILCFIYIICIAMSHGISLFITNTLIPILIPELI